MTEFVLEARDLKKRFGALVVADGVTLKLAAGARHALIGPNGAGKTTLVGLLTGTLKADSGNVILLGNDVTHARPATRVKYGLVRTFQVSSLFRHLTVFENVFLAANEHFGTSTMMFRPVRSNIAVINRVEEVLSHVGLAAVKDRVIAELPYGQQRLVEIGIALSLQPKALLLDEPAAGIPSDETRIMLSALEQLPSHIAVLIIEHDMQVVRRFATEVTVLVSGSILLSGSPKDVMASDEVRRVYLGRSGQRRFTIDTDHA